MTRFIENAREYPDVKIVCAHLGGGLPFYALMPEIREALENVWFDTAATPFLYEAGVFRTVVGLVGAEKILPGSDYPLIRYDRLRRQMAEAGMKPDDFAGDGPLRP